MKRTGEISLEDSIKTFTEDQDKIISPQETIDRFKPKLQSIESGILDSTVRIDNGRLGIPVFFSTCGTSAIDTIGTKKQMGKGATTAQAEASAVMELAERYSFFSFYKNPSNVIYDTYENIFVPEEILSFDLIAKSVNDQSDELDISEKIFRSLPLKWTGAYNLTKKREIIIPLDWFYAINAFNGPSSGNCPEEAICQGICEVVERHVSALIARDTLRTPTINLKSVYDPAITGMLDKYSKCGVNLYVNDFTLGMGIPSIGVLAYDPKTFPENSEIVWTAGTATSPQKALSRALTEVAQLAGDFNTGSNYVASGLPKFRSIKEFDFLHGKFDDIDIKHLPDLSDKNIKIEIENCINQLSCLDMDTIVVDTTHPILEIPAFYTIIPGTDFRERATKASVAMFSAKIAAENLPAHKAVKYLQNMDDLIPKKYYVQFYIAKCYLELGEHDLAVSHFYKAIELDPTGQDEAIIYSYLGICLKGLGKYKQAIQILKRGEMLDSRKTDIHNLKGFCYFMLEDYKAAIKSFERVIELDPSSAIDYANIGSSYRNMGIKSKAVRYYSLALAIDPSIEFAIENLKKLRLK